MKCPEIQAIEIKINKELETAKTLCELTPTKEEKDLIVSALTRLEKLEKAIEIVKRKLVDFAKLDYAINCDKSALNYFGEISRCEKYNLSQTSDYELTEEEFNLLKEVFGNGN